MKFGLFSDPHITKNMKEFSAKWDSCVIDSFTNMYEEFKKNSVDFVICAGDFFDKAVIEARNVPLINQVLARMCTIKTYMLLGNHEIDSNDHNILAAYSGVYDNIVPITDYWQRDNIVFIPYGKDLEEYKELYTNNIVITHHDIYGAELAGGKVKASFGYDPNIFNDAKIVFNGHVHLRSKVGKVYNVGSLFSSQFGELVEGKLDYPQYYIYDTETGNLTSYQNKSSLYYITCNIKEVGNVLETYSENDVILRINYVDENDLQDNKVLNLEDSVLKLYKRKIIDSRKVEDTEIVKTSTTIDIKEMISSYIDNDQTISDSDKSRLKEKCIDLVGG